MTETQGWVLITIAAIMAISGGFYLQAILIALDRVASKLDQIEGLTIELKSTADEHLSVAHFAQAAK